MRSRVILLCFTLLFIVDPALGQKRNITERDLFSFNWIADPQVSPDGSRVATSLLDHQRGTRNVWIYDTTRGLGAPFTTDTDE